MEEEEASVAKPQKAIATVVETKTELNEKPFSPVDGTIEEGLVLRAEERKDKLKQFNYRFNQNNRIEDMEREPAYKRQDIELTPPDNDTDASRTSLSMDSKDELQFRTNNSFLHDNVD